MEFDKAAVINAPPQRIWPRMFDLELARSCISGMEAVEPVGPSEYLAQIYVKLSFVSARFKIRLRITDTREAEYVRSEGTGEDSTLTSSLKLASEMFLTDRGNGATELRMKLKVDLFGRLGAFGLNVFKTKAERMWQESIAQFAARLSDE